MYISINYQLECAKNSLPTSVPCDGFILCPYLKQEVGKREG